ncbi:MAG TPA: SDR family oxidoreductase [Candidatus Binataceae bacterium]|jgi:NAD(P)-dependent dehydrogenase (short-subunit alcohol dehydrogenase family)|nr:SDR family oxidoreductase [Candidatus Binataceae bacterium]
MDITRVAIVTGAGRPWGMGRQTALQLAEKGLDVAVVDLREDWGRDAAEIIARQTSRRTLYIKADISKKADVQAMVGKVLAELGRVDVLINNAAIPIGQPIAEFTEETFHKVINVNLLGAMLCSQAVMGQMKEQKYGRIVNMASGAAVKPYKGAALYAAAKAGLIAFTRVLALEAAPEIVVTAVAPGWVHTAMGSESPPDDRDFERGIQDNPFGRPLWPSEVADVIVYAATSPHHALTGQTLHARGGSLPFM